ncbi:MAG: DUF6612 family protein [Lachnospiraceae bacterium]
MKKLVVLAMSLGLSFVMLTGCGKPTVESLIDGLSEKEVESQTMQMELEAALEIGVQGVTVEMGISSDLEIQAAGLNEDADEIVTYVKGEVGAEMAMLGLDETVPMEVYSVMEDDKVTSYGYNKDEDTWYYQEAELEDTVDQDTLDEVTEAMYTAIKEAGELAEETEEVEGEECYVITATLDGDAFADIMEPLSKTLDDLMEEAGVEDLDMVSYMEYLSADLTYYISKKEGYLVKSEIDMSDSDLYGMVEQIMKDMDAEGDMDQIDKISFSKLSVICTMSDINDTEVEVPDDVIDNAVEADDVTDVLDEIDDMTGATGVAEPDEPVVEPVDEPIDDPIDEPATPSPADYYHDGYVTLNKCDESSELLCEVAVPDGFTYDDVYSSPDYGYFYLDSSDGNGYLTVRNEALWPLYSVLTSGEVPDDLADYGYENYEVSTEVIGQVMGGEDCYLVRETYTSYDSAEDVIYLAVWYSDGGYNEYLTISFEEMDSDAVNSLSNSDFYDLAVEMLGE